MYVKRIEPCSAVNGDGLRLVIVFTGCSLNCPGCFSKELQEFGTGKKVRPDLFAMAIAKEYKQSNLLDGITLSGGNPPEQSDLVPFLQVLRKHLPKKATIWMWTGFDWSELQTNDTYKEQLKFLDVVVTGRFEQDKKVEHEYYGSSNQEVWRKINGEWVKDE